MIHVKPGVQFALLRSDIWGVLSLIEFVFKEHGAQCLITCGTDSHGLDDPHSNGFALDFRTHRIADAGVIHTELKRLLGDRYTVLFENAGLPEEHLHVQLRKELWRGIVYQETGKEWT